MVIPLQTLPSNVQEKIHVKLIQKFIVELVNVYYNVMDQHLVKIWVILIHHQLIYLNVLVIVQIKHHHHLYEQLHHQHHQQTHQQIYQQIIQQYHQQIYQHMLQHYYQHFHQQFQHYFQVAIHQFFQQIIHH